MLTGRAASSGRSAAARSRVRSRAAAVAIMKVRYAGMILVMAAAALAGCSKDKEVASIDPNALPTNYRSTLVQFLRQSLTNRADDRACTNPARRRLEHNPRTA